MTFSIEIQGRVQGVGFRPFIYQLATSLDISGYVLNNEYGVVTVVNCSQKMLITFMEELKTKAPQTSSVDSIVSSVVKAQNFKNFHIKKSKTGAFSSKIPPDFGMCKECKVELEDSSNRRYHYPFITCAQCGPRYTLINKLPYDRANTSMQKFNMCKACEIEYTDPKDRRYHAQTISCFECGPELSFFDNKFSVISNTMEESLSLAVQAIKKGKIVAIKGVGGYHLVGDATKDDVAKEFRIRKKRIAKPFAIMVKDSENAKLFSIISEEEEQLLNSVKRPIVILKKKENNIVSDLIAPDNSQIGIFVAYTPLYQLIINQLEIPLIVTSANVSGEPLCKTLKEIKKVEFLWDFCLNHNRNISNSCDDSVVFVENEKEFILRSARGYSPCYIDDKQSSEKNIIALGANQKSSVAMCGNNYIMMSEYLGDLHSIESVLHYKTHLKNLIKMNGLKTDSIVCDKHPFYESTRLAYQLKSENENLKVVQVQHHYAHILATMGVNSINTKVLGISFDGTGYGDDGKLWGAEFLICDRKKFKRVGHFKYFKLLGGEKAIKEPRRVALSFLFEIYGKNVLTMSHPTINTFSKNELTTLYTVWKKDINAPLSSSCGRIFDAVASLLDIVHVISYEGQSGMLLESLYDDSNSEHYFYTFENGIVDFSTIIVQIMNEVDSNIAVTKFFNTLVEIIYTLHQRYKIPLVLGGGVFQNRVLLRLIMKKIPDVIVPKNFVSNDWSVAYGQVIYALNNENNLE